MLDVEMGNCEHTEKRQPKDGFFQSRMGTLQSLRKLNAHSRWVR